MSCKVSTDRSGHLIGGVVLDDEMGGATTFDERGSQHMMKWYI